MDSAPTERCDCWRLVHPLAPGEPLPDHLCQETMMETTRRAIADGLLPESDLWPVRVGKTSRAVGCVVRQWIEGDANKVLAQQLFSEKAWQREARALLNTFRLWQEQQPEGNIQDWIAGKGVAGLRLADRLRRADLPYNPAVVTHLRAVTANLDAFRRQDPKSKHFEAIVRDAENVRPEDYLRAQKQLADVKADKCEPFPAFGALLTTYMYVETLPMWIGVCRATEIEILTPIELIKDDLLDPLRRATIGHRDWFRTFKQHPLTDKRKTHQAAELLRHPAVILPDAPNTFLQEALRDDQLADLRKECRKRPNSRNEVIRHYLNKAADRARLRLKKQMSDPTPPKKWREEARQLIDRLL